ncbi:Wzz/FepE/Etk N-terminal domain-containing protein [Salinisphaera sp. SPP-AMP-43]|uniref:GumC family protein n=1 Tax=Salinisphaera sp. SPP-AMP-43 TaxID=3121288 RepID=UPI003C6E695E
MNAPLDRPLIPGSRRSPTPGQIGRALAARWRIIALTTAVFVLFALAITWLTPATYTARASLVIEFPGSDPVTGEMRSSNLADSYAATQIDLLTSHKVLLGVVKQLKFTAEPEALSEFEATDESRDHFDDWLANNLARHLAVEAGPASRLVVVGYTSEDPGQAAAVVNAVIDQYREASGALAIDPAKSRQSRFTGFLSNLRHEVDDAQSALADARQRLGLIDTNGSRSVDANRLVDLGTRLNAAESDQQLAAAQLEQIRQARSAGTSMADQADVLDSSYIQQIKNRLVDLQSQRSELAGDLGPNHPRLRALNSQIATVRAKLAHEINAYITSRQSEAQTASDRVQRLQKTYDNTRERVMDEQHKQAELASYERRLNSAQQVYLAALGNYDRVLGGSELQQQNISVVSPATPPSQPTGLSSNARVLLALVAGAVVGAMLALLRELFDRRIRAAEDIRRELDMPVLGELLPGTR